jgi:hypothetical protein
MRRLIAVALAVLASSSVSTRLGATVLVPIDFRELVAVSSTIVRGRVADVHAEWIDGRRSLETLITIEAQEYYKGSLGGTVTVRTPGGQLGRYRTIFVGAPEFRQGDEVILFLRGNSGVQIIVGLNQGAFRVAADASGRRMVTSPVLMAKSDQPAAVVRGDAARRPLPVEAFRDLVRRVIGGGAAQ